MRFLKKLSKKKASSKLKKRRLYIRTIKVFERRDLLIAMMSGSAAFLARDILEFFIRFARGFAGK